ncbi:MAG: hypothetical protein ACO1O6_01030 [Bacteroidota bacterium]
MNGRPGIYAYYFLAKTIALLSHSSFSWNDVGYLACYPIGVWSIQSRINKIFGKD